MASCQRWWVCRAFTLVELLLMLGILAALASFVVVATQNIRRTARDVARLHDVKALSQAVMLYREDTGHWPSPTSLEGHSGLACFAPDDAFCAAVPEILMGSSDLPVMLAPYTNPIPKLNLSYLEYYLWYVVHEGTTTTFDPGVYLVYSLERPILSTECAPPSQLLTIGSFGDGVTVCFVWLGEPD